MFILDPEALKNLHHAIRPSNPPGYRMKMDSSVSCLPCSISRPFSADTGLVNSCSADRRLVVGGGYRQDRPESADRESREEDSQERKGVVIEFGVLSSLLPP